MTVRHSRTIRVVVFALAFACLATAALSAAGAPGSGSTPATTRPTRPPEVTVGPASQAARGTRLEVPTPARPSTTRPAPAPAAVRSDVGQRAIRRDDGNTASTQPAPSPTGAAPAAAPPAGSTLELSKVAGALALVLALIFVLWTVMRRAFGATGPAGSSRAVQLLSRTVLSPKQHLMLVRVGKRLIVVADSGGQMSPLSEITDPDEVAALVGQVRDEKLTGAAPTFGGLLGRLRNGTDAGGASGESDQMQAATTRPDRHDGPTDEDGAEATSTRQEINGLLAKVRLLSHQFKGS